MTCTWNPSDCAANFTLSNGNLTVTSNSATFGSVRSTQLWVGGVGVVASSYIRYHELTFSSASNCGIGISDNGELTSNYLGQTSHGCGYYANGAVRIQGLAPTTYATFTPPITVGMVTRFANQKAWWTINGTTFNNDIIANQNPITNVGGFDIGAFTAGGGVFGNTGTGFFNVFAAFGSFASGNSATANFGATPFVYASLFSSVVVIGGAAWDGSTGGSSQFMFAA